MPFKSEAQRRFMYAKHPKIAKRWAKEYDAGSGLPEKATVSRIKAVIKSKRKG